MKQNNRQHHGVLPRFDPASHQHIPQDEILQPVTKAHCDCLELYSL